MVLISVSLIHQQILKYYLAFTHASIPEASNTAVIAARIPVTLESWEERLITNLRGYLALRPNPVWDQYHELAQLFYCSVLL